MDQDKRQISHDAAASLHDTIQHMQHKLTMAYAQCKLQWHIPSSTIDALSYIMKDQNTQVLGSLREHLHGRLSGQSLDTVEAAIDALLTIHDDGQHATPWARKKAIDAALNPVDVHTRTILDDEGNVIT